MIAIPAQQFIADTMLGKLVKWLRVMGIDVVYDAAAANDQLLHAAEWERRILLTRNHRLAWRRENAASASFLFIESDYYHEQVRQVVEKFGLALEIRVFTRCLRCNGLLKSVRREAIIGKVPPYILASQTTFKHCMVCDRVYWPGTHRDRMLQQLQVMLGRGLWAFAQHIP
jgi:uncharacterized protein with PIN domain